MNEAINTGEKFLRALIFIIWVSTVTVAQSKTEASWPPQPMEREKEIELALSAAPEHLRKDASVYVLERKGYVKVKEGTNGFTCLVHQESNGAIGPICYDREGAETTLIADLRAAELRGQGKSEAETERIIEDEYRAGKLLAPRKPGIAYMLSTEFKIHDHKTGKVTTVFPPHVMFYAPYMKNSDIGALPEHRGSQSRPWILNEGKPSAYIIMVPADKH